MSFEACRIARSNAVKLGADVQFVEADLLKSFGDGIAGIIVSNPPYVPFSDRALLQREVRELGAVPRLVRRPVRNRCLQTAIPEAKRALKPGGILALELGFGQSEAVSELASGWDNLQLISDLAGIPRVLVCEKP